MSSQDNPFVAIDRNIDLCAFVLGTVIRSQQKARHEGQFRKWKT